MIFAKLDNWKDGFRHDGMLYFTQRIAEMLFHYSDHIYRTPVLNTYLLFFEYFHTVDLIKEGTINENHKRYILDELLDSFHDDIVIRKYMDEKEIEKIIHEINSSNDIERDKVLDYLKAKISDYDFWCKEYLRELVVEGKQKTKINKILKSYIPGLIGAGYDREFIYHFNEKIFALQDVVSIDSLDVFLDRFDYSEKEYDVYIPVKKELEKFKKLFSSRFRDFEVVNKKDLSDFIYNEDKFFLVKIHVSALEENSAAFCAFERLNLFFRFYKFLGNNLRVLTHKKGMVVDESGEHVVVTLKKDSYSIPMLMDSNGACDIADELILSISESSDSGTIDTIEKVFDLHNLAIRADNLKNGYLNFWSITEIVFVNNNNRTKIENIESKLLPILQMDYIHKLILDLEEKLNANVGDEIKILKQNLNIKDDESFVMKALSQSTITAPVLKTDECDCKEKLYSVLADYPILRTRYNDIETIFSSKENLKKELDRMKQRMDWHIRRLYRTRNSIIHSGEEVHYLKDLGEHLHNYIDVFMMYILLNLFDLETVDNVILDCRFKFESIMARIGGKGKLSVEDFNFIIKQAKF